MTRACDTLLSKQDVWGHRSMEYKDSLHKVPLFVKGFALGISELECSPEWVVQYSPFWTQIRSHKRSKSCL